jgi:hypothetical protein
LSLVSGTFLRDHERIINELTNSGHASLLHYVLQQVQQFRRLGKDFAMQHTDTEYLDEVEEELQAAVLRSIPVEKRLQGLSPEDLLPSIPVEKRLQGLSPEDRVQGLSPEELAAGLSKEQAARLRELLERREDEASAPDKG